MLRYIKEKFETSKLARENRALKKECKTLKAENEILKSALRMHKEESGKKNATFPQKNLKY